MAIKIRLARGGAKKRAYYRIVVAQSTSPRDGKYIERLGSYNPMLAGTDENRVLLNRERIEYWLSHGATPTEKVARFLLNAKIDIKNKKLVEHINQLKKRGKKQETVQAAAAE